MEEMRIGFLRWQSESLCNRSLSCFTLSPLNLSTAASVVVAMVDNASRLD